MGHDQSALGGDKDRSLGAESVCSQQRVRDARMTEGRCETDALKAGPRMYRRYKNMKNSIYQKSTFRPFGCRAPCKLGGARPLV